VRSQKWQLVNAHLYWVNNSYLRRTILFIKTICIKFYIWYFNIYLKFQRTFIFPLCWAMLCYSSFKVVWHTLSSHGVYNLLLLTFCMSYCLIFSFHLFCGFCFLLVKLTFDADYCFFMYLMLSSHKMTSNFFKRFFTWQPDDGSVADWNMQLCSNKSEQLF
jgi:hypothetical protein